MADAGDWLSADLTKCIERAIDRVKISVGHRQRWRWRYLWIVLWEEAWASNTYSKALRAWLTVMLPFTP